MLKSEFIVIRWNIFFFLLISDNFLNFYKEINFKKLICNLFVKKKKYNKFKFSKIKS